MDLQNIIEQAWEQRQQLSALNLVQIKEAINQVISSLDKGELRVAQKQGTEWIVNQWIKKAVLFRLD